MKAIPYICWALNILAFCFHPLPATAAPTNQPAGFRLTVELLDGSKIIGKNGDDQFLFHSDVLGEMKLPLERIRSIGGSAQTNSILLTTVSGDTLTARFVTRVVRVETAFGGVKLPVNLIRHLTALPAGNPGHRREGLVAWWPGEGNANDMAGTHNGTWLNGPGYAKGESGQAFRFGGIGLQQSIDIPYSPALINPTYSVEAWINPMAKPANAENQDWIFGQNMGLQLNIRNGTTGVYAAFQFRSGASFYDVVSAAQIPLNTFTHVAGTWEGTTLRLYINGASSNSRNPGTAPMDSGCDFFIGGVNNPAGGMCNYVGQFFRGSIDEVSLYNRALTAAEIQSDYEAGLSGN
jgi:hypothetical protein